MLDDLSTAHARIDQWEADLADRVARANALVGRLAELRATGRDRDGLVEVRVDANGVPVDLWLSESVRQWSASEIARQVMAALREAQEETGLDPSGVTIVGTMPEVYVWRSDNRVTPVLGWWHTPCAVHPAAPDEVDAVERVPIAELVDPRNRLRLRSPRGIIGPAFRVRGLLVWGFTAAVLSGVLTAAGFDRPWNRGRIEDLPPDILNLAAR